MVFLISVCAGIQADPQNAEERKEQAGDHCQQHSPSEKVSHWQHFVDILKDSAPLLYMPGRSQYLHEYKSQLLPQRYSKPAIRL